MDQVLALRSLCGPRRRTLRALRLEAIRPPPTGHGGPWLNCSRRTAPPRREPWNDRMSCVGLTFQGTWKKGENRTEPAVNSPTYSYTPRHFVPVGSSMLGHWVPGAERMRTLPVQMLRQSHALMLSWHAGARSAYGPSLNEVCPYYGPSKIGSSLKELDQRRS